MALAPLSDDEFDPYESDFGEADFEPGESLSLDAPAALAFGSVAAAPAAYGGPKETPRTEEAAFQAAMYDDGESRGYRSSADDALLLGNVDALLHRERSRLCLPEADGAPLPPYGVFEATPSGAPPAPRTSDPKAAADVAARKMRVSFDADSLGGSGGSWRGVPPAGDEYDDAEGFEDDVEDEAPLKPAPGQPALLKPAPGQPTSLKPAPGQPTVSAAAPPRQPPPKPVPRPRRSAVSTAQAISVGGVTLSAAQASLMGVSDKKGLMKQVALMLKLKPPKPPSEAAAARKLEAEKLEDLTRPPPAKVAGHARRARHWAEKAEAEEADSAKRPAEVGRAASGVAGKGGRRFMTRDMAKNCTFIPNLSNAAKLAAEKECAYDFSGQERQVNGEWVDRLSAAERARRLKLEYTRGKRLYDAQIHKKSCPLCGAEQAYDELAEKRNDCSLGCKAQYQVWRPKESKGADAWLKTQEKWLTDKKEEAVKAQEARDRADAAQRVGSTQHDAYHASLRAKVEATSGPFLDRLYDDLEKRKAKQRALETTKANEAGPSFKPHMPGMQKVADFELQKRADLRAAQQPGPRATAPYATAPQKRPGPAMASKWEDDLEEYLGAMAVERKSAHDKKAKAASTAKTRKANRPRAETARPASARPASARPSSRPDKASRTRTAGVDEAIFDNLL
ncbi:hypothetical protein M885DRAFT_529462 [Pelagophyceae sp. CCMP2097]|nr:hypothetical protein M885DRAFT_529462 [Pelagophyceae sp. CCMP2097]